MGKYGRVRQARYENIIWRMRFTCWLTKATDTLLKYVILIAFLWQQWIRCYIYSTLPILTGKASACTDAEGRSRTDGRTDGRMDVCNFHIRRASFLISRGCLQTQFLLQPPI
jgi:hypothetical protein